MLKSVRGWLFDLYPSGKGITLWVVDKNGEKFMGYAPFAPKFHMHVGKEEKNRVESIAQRNR